ncbi:uncharacterized protein [Notamacropus eugenii]|uniref:uncharacterized protein n=1 Tax=Notamacropus eugenii TaxID=9315 RepID=UPI003B673EF1
MSSWKCSLNKQMEFAALKVLNARLLTVRYDTEEIPVQAPVCDYQTARLRPISPAPPRHIHSLGRPAASEAGALGCPVSPRRPRGFPPPTPWTRPAPPLPPLPSGLASTGSAGRGAVVRSSRAGGEGAPRAAPRLPRPPRQRQGERRASAELEPPLPAAGSRPPGPEALTHLPPPESDSSAAACLCLGRQSPPSATASPMTTGPPIFILWGLSLVIVGAALGLDW